LKTALEQLAIAGGRPVRTSPLPYGRQCLDPSDLCAVAEALASDWLTTGPRVAAFEAAFAELVGTQHAVAVSSGTAALHAAMHVLDLQPGDEVIVPAITFAATANSAVYERAVPVFADVDSETLQLGAAQAEAVATDRTRALIAVDYAGQPCDYTALADWAERRQVQLVADACHSLGGSYRGRPVGSLARLNCFSLHPVKAMTSGEGGVISTDDAVLAQRLRRFRNHGLTQPDPVARPWHAEQVELGWNYRLTDFQAALAASQLTKLAGWINQREQLATRYDAACFELPALRPLTSLDNRRHAWHLYVVQLELERLRVDRDTIVQALRAEGIGVQVHYRPVHLQPFYRTRYGTRPGQCPVAEHAAERIISLPLFPAMTPADQDDVIQSLEKVIQHYLK
jgi:perosamine synthetase